MTETYRRCIETRRLTEFGGGACTLLVRSLDGCVHVLFHCSPETGAVLTGEQARALADALIDASGDAMPAHAGDEPGGVS
ncbi:MAG: hypothetical protein GEU98_26005 [Pseudonocardiaceae bacterium]|nr:hypothetical protein [Pseudonocardiaceae bacterium]